MARFNPLTFGTILLMAPACEFLGGGSKSSETSDPDTALPETDPTIELSFASEASSAEEASGVAEFTVLLSDASPDPLLIGVSITGGTARQHEAGTGPDFLFTDTELEIPAGETSAEFQFELLDDAFYESDETALLTLSAPEGVALGSVSEHTFEILDDDRPDLYSVSDFGALGDGLTDDTEAIQSAVDALHAAGGGVLIFPSGTYVVTAVEIYPGISYVGYGATLLRPSREDLEALGFDPYSVRTFNTTAVPWSSTEDSMPLIIQGLSFDGNRPEQGDYQAHELEQAALIFLSADAEQPGRLRAYVEDCHLVDGVGDGIHARQNLEIAVDNCEAIDVFRGGFTLTGGNTEAVVTRLSTSGDTDPGGIDIEIDGPGYEDSYQVTVTLDELSLADGDLDIALKPGSTVTASDVVSDAPFYLYAPESTVRFSDSTIAVGATDDYLNRIVCPGDLRFERCDLIATRKETSRTHQFFSVLDVYWQHEVCAEHTGENSQNNQHVQVVDSRILIDDNFLADDIVYAIYSVSDIGEDGTWGSGNRLTVEGGCIDEGFDEVVVLYHESSVVPEISETTTTCKPD